MNNKQKAYKLNCIELMRHHKQFCLMEDCGVSLILLKQMAEEVGVVFTEKEIEEFI